MPYYVYIMCNKAGTVLYTGVTNDLVRRVAEHKQKAHPGFTSRYNVNCLVWFADCEDVTSAIQEEKRIKGGSRRKKLELINAMNPQWKDLYEEILG